VFVWLFVCLFVASFDRLRCRRRAIIIATAMLDV